MSVPVPGGGDGLVQPSRVVVAAVEQHGGGVLRGSVGRGVAVPTGHVLYICKSCSHFWKRGRRNFGRNETIVCESCAKKPIGKCVVCEATVQGNEAHDIDGVAACRSCFQAKAPVWCPECLGLFEFGGYLRILFRNDVSAFHAAALVTHYRHRHVASHDRAWSNRRYAARIPDYSYDDYKEKSNNQAKRQLIRAVKKLVETNEYPTSAPLPPADLVQGFSRLQDNDEDTNSLIVKTLDFLINHTPSDR